MREEARLAMERSGPIFANCRGGSGRPTAVIEGLCEHARASMPMQSVLWHSQRLHGGRRWTFRATPRPPLPHARRRRAPRRRTCRRASRRSLRRPKACALHSETLDVQRLRTPSSCLLFNHRNAAASPALSRHIGDIGAGSAPHGAVPHLRRDCSLGARLRRGRFLSGAVLRAGDAPADAVRKSQSARCTAQYCNCR